MIFLPCKECFFCHAHLEENQSEASPLTLNTPLSLTRRKFPNVTLYLVEQTQAEAQICGICYESEVGLSHNSEFQLQSAAAQGFRPKLSRDLDGS